MYRFLAFLNVFGLIAVLFVNYLANALPINGYTTGELSDLYPNLFVPAGITFSIWGIIYLFLIGFVIHQFVKTDFKHLETHHFIPRIWIYFILNCLLNIAWILTWHHRLMVLSVCIMLGLLATLIIIYTRLEIGKRKVSVINQWLVHIPFSIYLGWITVATIANITALMVSQGWNGFGISESIWSIIMILVATLVGLIVFHKRRDWAYVCVLIWAFLGIYIKRNGLEGYQDSIAIAAVAGMATLIIRMIVYLLRKK